MELKLIEYNTAKLLKEIGLEEGLSCNYHYCIGYKEVPEDKKVIKLDYIKSSVKGQFHLALAPTQAIIQQWLREVHNIHIFLCRLPKHWEIMISQIFPYKMLFDSYIEYDTYEDALEAGILESINIIKTKQK